MSTTKIQFAVEEICRQHSRLGERPFETLIRLMDSGLLTEREFGKYRGIGPGGCQMFRYLFGYESGVLFRDKDSIRVSQIGLSVRAQVLLEQMNILTVGDLRRTPRCAFIKKRNIGQKSMKEIEEALKNLIFT